MKRLQFTVSPPPDQISPAVNRGEKENLTLHIIRQVLARESALLRRLSGRVHSLVPGITL